jgi:hypothetical protein
MLAFAGMTGVDRLPKDQSSSSGSLPEQIQVNFYRFKRHEYGIFRRAPDQAMLFEFPDIGVYV